MKETSRSQDKYDASDLCPDLSGRPPRLEAFHPGVKFVHVLLHLPDRVLFALKMAGLPRRIVKVLPSTT